MQTKFQWPHKVFCDGEKIIHKMHIPLPTVALGKQSLIRLKETVCLIFRT
jgi:hypothetical protein